MARGKKGKVEKLLEDEFVAPVAAAAPYHDQESEWEDMKFVEKESETKQVFESFTGGTAKGIAGKTDLTGPQSVALTHIRVMQHQFQKRGFTWLAEELALFPEWFETYRLSIGRKSRTESVDILRGRMQLGQDKQAQANDPSRFQ